MKRTASPAAAHRAARNGLVELQCPECTGTVRVARDELIEGAPLECLHCGIEAELRRDYDVFTHRKHWFLIDPLRERDADEERRS
jgi:hypothetical protein